MVPSLDDLVRDPQIAETLPRPVAAALLSSALHVAVVVVRPGHDGRPRPGSGGSGATGGTPGEPEWIGVDEVTRRFGLTRATGSKITPPS